MKYLHSALITCIAFGCATFAHAQSLFEFGGDVVNSGQPFRLTAKTYAGPDVTDRPFSESLSLSRLPGELYRGPALYGGWIAQGDVAPSTAGSQIVDRGANDAMLFRFLNTGSDPATLSALVLGMLARPVAPENLDSFEFLADRTGLQQGSVARPVVQQGGRYFISSETFPIDTAGAAQPVIIPADALVWLGYDPMVSLTETTDEGTLDPEQPVRMGGFLFQHTLPGGSAKEHSLTIESISIQPKQ